MAYGDFASFLPSEAYYTGPKGGMDAARVEAIKKASYLSQMDQFYAQLAEVERQFDITAGLHRDVFEFERGERFEFEKEMGREELGLKREALEFEMGPRFEWEKEYGMGELELRGEDIEMRREIGLEGPRAAKEASEWGYKLGMEELEWKREEAEITEEFLEDYFKRQETKEIGHYEGEIEWT